MDIEFDKIICQAYQWCCKQRLKHPPGDSIWDVRKHWEAIRPVLIKQFLAGKHQFSPVRRIVKNNHDVVWIWDAQDAIILKAIAIACETAYYREHFSGACISIKTHGGITAANKKIVRHMQTHPFVFKSDVKSFYDSIDHSVLLKKCHTKITDDFILKTIARFLNHLEDRDGIYFERNIGISKSCPLSPVLGAIYLTELDQAMDKLPMMYCRYADDWIIMAKTRSHLRKAIKRCNECLNRLKMKQHPDKTIILRLDTKTGTNTFDFLGFTFSAKGLIGIRTETVKRYASKLRRLYEQMETQKKSRPKCPLFDLMVTRRAQTKAQRLRHRFASWAKGCGCDVTYFDELISPQR